MDAKVLKSRLILIVGTALISVGFASKQSLDVTQTNTEKLVRIEAGLGDKLEAEILRLSELTDISIEEMLQDMLKTEQQSENMQIK